MDKADLSSPWDGITSEGKGVIFNPAATVQPVSGSTQSSLIDLMVVIECDRRRFLRYWIRSSVWYMSVCNTDWMLSLFLQGLPGPAGKPGQPGKRGPRVSLLGRSQTPPVPWQTIQFTTSRNDFILSNNFMLISVSLFRFTVGISLRACVFVCVFATAADVHVDSKLRHKQSVNNPLGREVTDRQTDSQGQRVL